MKIKTLADLKYFLSLLNDKQLKQPPTLQIVDSGTQDIVSVTITDEIEVLTDEGYVPLSEMQFEEGDNIDNYDIREAGHVYLFNE